MKHAVLEDLDRNLLLLQLSITIVQTDQGDRIVSEAGGALRWCFLGSSLNQVSLRGSACRNTLLLNLDDRVRQWEGLQKEVRVQTDVDCVQHHHGCECGGLHEMAVSG